MTALDTMKAKDGVDQETVDAVQSVEKYKYGFSTDIEMDFAPKGVNEDIVRLISSKNEEPEWMTEWRLQAFRRWQQMDEPDWAMPSMPTAGFWLTPGPKMHSVILNWLALHRRL